MDPLKFTWRVLRSRWFLIVAGMWILSFQGASYAFGLYSQSIKLELNYDQKTLDTLAFFKGVGGNVGIISGFVYDVLPPWVVIVIGAAETTFGYLLMWLSVTGRLPTPKLWQMCAYICLATNGMTFFSTTVVVTCVKTFPNSRGTVIGLMKGLVGLSGAILTQAFYALYPGRPQSFLLMVSWLPSSIALLFMAVIRPIPRTDEGRKDYQFNIFSAIAVSLAAYLMGVIILESVLDLGHISSLVVCLITFAFLLAPVGVVISAELKTVQADEQASLKEPLFNSEKGSPACHTNLQQSHGDDRVGEIRAEPSFFPRVNEPNDVRDGQMRADNELRWSESHSAGDHQFSHQRMLARPDVSSSKCERGEDYTLVQALSSLDFWLLVTTMGCSMGSGLAAMDNIGQVGISLGHLQNEINTLISVLSIWNFLGRFGAGSVSDLFLRTRGIPRPLFLVLSLVGMCVGHLVMASAIWGSLYVGIIIIGLCYGAQWSLMPAITSEIFGLKYFGTLFNTITIASPIGSSILSVGVAGYLYDKEASKEHHLHMGFSMVRVYTSMYASLGDSETLLCHGAHCFRLTFIIMACVCLFGCGVATCLLFRTRHLYQKICERLHHGQQLDA